MSKKPDFKAKMADMRKRAGDAPAPSGKPFAAKPAGDKPAKKATAGRQFGVKLTGEATDAMSRLQVALAPHGLAGTAASPLISAALIRVADLLDGDGGDSYVERLRDVLASDNRRKVNKS